MAQRRMFSLKIIDTDLFLDMPISTQLLYFHLSMRADDDGFVASPKKITKMVNCSDDDLKILRLKNFIIPFESGICVIKHWKIHNYIQADRYNETQYLEEKSQIVEVDNGSYEPCIQNGYNMDTQVRLGKDRLEIELGKDRKGKDILETHVSENVPYDDIVFKFNEICTSLSKVVTINKKRKDKLKTRWGEIKDLETFEILFRKVQDSSFLKGDNKSGWKCTFDWLIDNDNNYVKVLEGQYEQSNKMDQYKELMGYAAQSEHKGGIFGD